VSAVVVHDGSVLLRFDSYDSAINAGPGTGEHHIALRNEMESVIESMLAEGKR